MKQHITRNQLVEVDMDKLEELTGIPTLYDYPEKITIGKMIEILKAYAVTDIGIKLNSDRNNISTWKGNGLDKRFFAEEICDSLWEAVKYNLKYSAKQ